MFRANKEQQTSMVDRLCLLSDADRRELESSWAATFATDAFDRIDEEPFAVLFDKSKGRRNAPVNVLVGALMIKELLGVTDERLVGDIKWDLRLQYALRTTSFLRQPVSLRTLARFRVRVYRHYLETGVDLIKQCVRGLAAHACAEMEIDGSVRRMDSMMVESSAKVLSREELIYECMANVCRHLAKARPGLLPRRLERYADRDDLNRTFYHDEKTPRERRTKRILADADALVELLGGDALEGDEKGEAKLALLLRALEEQTIVDDALAAGASQAEAAGTATTCGDTAAPDGEPEAGAACGGDSDLDEAVVAGVDGASAIDASPAQGADAATCGDSAGTGDEPEVGMACGGAADGHDGDNADSGAECPPAEGGDDRNDSGDSDGAPAADGDGDRTADGNDSARSDKGDAAGAYGDKDSTTKKKGDDSSTNSGIDGTRTAKGDGTDTDGDEYDTNRRMRTREDGMPAGSNMLQSPHDPEATFRRKAGRNHRGFAANFEESCGANGTIITNYQYGPNNTSDAEFLRQSLEDAGPVEGGAMLVADGGYDGEDNIALAAEKGIELVTTSLTGKDPADCLADFEWSADGRSLLRCAAGHEPDGCGFYESSGQVRASFAAGTCAGCPLRGQCRARCGKRVDSVTASPKSTRRARHLRRMETEEFKAISRLRNGAETVPSTMRRKYRIDDVPAGTAMGGIWVGFKVAAMNFRKLEDFRRGRGGYRRNPLLGERTA